MRKVDKKVLRKVMDLMKAEGLDYHDMMSMGYEIGIGVVLLFFSNKALTKEAAIDMFDVYQDAAYGALDELDRTIIIN